jgi:hypothetical protein
LLPFINRESAWGIGRLAASALWWFLYQFWGGCYTSFGETTDENRTSYDSSAINYKHNVERLIREVAGSDQALRSISETREAELEEEAQQERDSRVLNN